MAPFRSTPLNIPDVVLITPGVFEDPRGFFMETYRESGFREIGITASFRQDNHSMSAKGVLRGLHYQLAPAAQGKLVRVASGAIFDVAVDIRKGSPWFGKWVGVELSAANKNILWIPEGFAHGFCALEDGTNVLYKSTGEYSPAHDRGIRWDDPAIGIEWPVKSPLVSGKDAALPRLAEAENDFSYTGDKK